MQTKHVAESNLQIEKDPLTKPDESSLSKDTTNMADCLNSSKIKTNLPGYFNSSDNKETDKKQARQSQIECTMNLFICSLIQVVLKVHSPYLVKEGNNPYQAPLRNVAYNLQKPLEEELEWLEKQQIMAPLGFDKNMRIVQQLCFGT